VGDDNYTPYPEVSYSIDHSSLMKHHVFEADLGIGKVLNYILTQIKTEYFVLLEDDFEFSDLTNIETLIAHIENGEFDISGGACRNYENGTLGSFQGYFNWDNYPIAPGPYEFYDMKTLTEPKIFDTIVNFFAARTEDVTPFGWSEELKVARHVDFFLRAGGWRPRSGKYPVARPLKVGYNPSVEIIHHGKEIEDKEFRRPRDDHRTRRMPEFKQMYLDLWGFLPPPEGIVET